MDIRFISKYEIEGVNKGTITECYNYCTTKTTLGLDIETSSKRFQHPKSKDNYKGGLDPYLSNICMLQIGDLDKIFVIDVRDFTKEELQPIIKLLNWNDKITFVGVNLKFECMHLKHKFGINLKKMWDCMIVEMCLYNGLPREFSLVGLAKAYLNVKSVDDNPLFTIEELSKTLDDYHLEENEYLLTPFEINDNIQIDKSTRMQFVNLSNHPFTHKQVMYGADDILYPLHIMERQLLGRDLGADGIYLPTKLIRMENSFIGASADMQLNGMPLCQDKWVELAVKQEAILLERTSILNKYVLQFYPKFKEQANLFDYEAKCSIEWSSSKQVIELFKLIERCPKEFSKQSKKVDYSVGAVALLKTLPNNYKGCYLQQNWVGFSVDDNGDFIEDHDKLILAYLLMKKTEQLVTSFGRSWLKYVHPTTNRVHTRFRQILNSGRMASSAPNCQQIPNGEYRDAFTNGIDNPIDMVFADFSNQEVRTVACIASEETMIKFFQEGHEIYGDDLHMLTANKMYQTKNKVTTDLPPTGHKDFSKDDNKLRNEAKIISFGLLYGKVAKGFAVDFGITEEEAQVFIDSYFGAYPSLRASILQWEKEALNNGYIKIDDIVDRRWFSNDFKKLTELYDEVKAYFPPDYFTFKMSKVDKERVKKEVNENYPEVKKLWREYFGIQGSIKRKATNYKIQGTSASETKAALILLRKKLIESGLENTIKILIVVHDEIGIEVLNNKYTNEASALLKECMEEGANLFLTPKIMKATPVVGKCWIH